MLAACPPEGEQEVGGVRILRFRADRRDERKLRQIEGRLNAAGSPPGERAASLDEVEMNALLANRFNSTQLLTYLARHIDDFDSIVFVGDYTGLTLRGWRIAAGRTAVLIKIENVADSYLPPAAGMMFGVGCVLVRSDEEQALARKIHGPGIAARTRVVGSLGHGDEGSFDRFRAALLEIAAQHGPGPRQEAAPIVHHLARAEYAQSETLLALQLDALLRRSGYRSCVVSSYRDDRLGGQVVDPPESGGPDAISIAYGKQGELDQARPFLGKMSLDDALPVFERGDGLRVRIPLFLDNEAWNVEPQREVMLPLADGQTNLLCVGDVRPDNRVLELVEVFRYYITMDFKSRLIVAGTHVDAGYAQRVREHIARRGLGGRVQLTGTVSRPALAAMYRTARAFVSLRDRYETGLSLLEAMAFDVPICVRDNPSARAVTGGKAILFSGLASAFEVAALWRVVTSDEPLRDRLVGSQRAQLASLTPDRTRRALEEALGLAPNLVRA